MAAIAGLLALCVAFVPAHAQQASGTPATEEKSLQPTAIPAALIPEQADQDERFALAATARATAFDANGALARQLGHIHEGIRALRADFRAEQLAELTAPRLDSLDNYWSLYQRKLDQWDDKVQAITNRYSGDAAELAKRRAAWEVTLEAASAGNLAPALGDRARDIIDQIGAAQATISTPLQAAIALGRQGNQIQLEIEAGRTSLTGAITSYTRRLLQVDMPPLWETHRRQQVTSDTTVEDVEIRFIKEYSGDRYRQLRAFGIAWLASLPLFLWFSRRERKRNGADLAPVVRRPISGWLLLGSLLMPILFHNAPVALTQLALLIGLIPVLRLLPQTAFQLLRWLPYAIVALYFLHRLRVFIWDDPLLYRVHLLAIDVIAASIAVWLLHYSHHRNSILQGHRRTFVRALGCLAIAALMVGAVANLVGNVSLAEMLTSGVLESTYIGLAIYAALVALLVIGAALIRAPETEGTTFVSRNVTPLLSALQTPIKVGALLLWLVVTVSEFQIYRPTAEWLTATLTKPIPIGELDVTLGGILMFFAGVWIALLIARAVRVLLLNEVLSGMRLPPGVANSVSSLTYYALVFVGFLVALAASGFQMSQLTLIIGALGVGIGLGLQNVVGNFVSGLILMFERPIRPGDVVEVGGTNGRVREIGMRATTVQTFEGADVVVPNGTLLQANLINWTLNNTNRRIAVEVGVAYSADPPAVQTLLTEVARTIPGVSTNPSPIVLFMRFNSSSIDFSVRAWTSDFDSWLSIQSELGVAVHRALKEAGIEIPFPQQDLHVRSVSDESRPRLALKKPASDQGGDEGPA